LEELMKQTRIPFLAVVLLCASLAGTALAADMHMSTKFEGPKANTGTVTHSTKGGKSILTLSADFVAPETPDPHWQVVDSAGRVYQLDKLKVKSVVGDKIKTEIEVPSYVPNIARVRMYCAWAEVVLGEASFAKPVK